MVDFTFQTPTKVIFGRNAEDCAAREIKRMGYKKVLVHYGGQSAQKSGLLDRVCGSLTQEGIGYVRLGGVQPNPKLGLVREGISLCRREKVDFLLAVGGGSVIDSAKAISYGITNDFDVWELYSQKRTAEDCAPLGVILTIAAAGSETSNSSVITNEDGMLKRFYDDDLSRPRFAAMNPELTYTLPAYQTACGIVDILMHTMERYFTNVKNVELTDRMSEALMVTVVENAARVMQDPRDYDTRAELMWAGSLSHNGLTGTGRVGDFACHMMEHELSGMFDGIAHGAGLAAIWGSWARYVLNNDVARFARFAVEVMGCRMNYQNPEETARQGIQRLEDFFIGIGMPVSLSGLGIGSVTIQQIEEMADKCSMHGKQTIGQFVELAMPDMIGIYKMAAGK